MVHRLASVEVHLCKDLLLGVQSVADEAKALEQLQPLDLDRFELFLGIDVNYIEDVLFGLLQVFLHRIEEEERSHYLQFGGECFVEFVPHDESQHFEAVLLKELLEAVLDQSSLESRSQSQFV